MHTHSQHCNTENKPHKLLIVSEPNGNILDLQYDRATPTNKLTEALRGPVVNVTISELTWMF